MTEELDIDDIEKLFSVFGYHLEKSVGYCLDKAVEMYVVRDSDERVVHCEGLYDTMNSALNYRSIHILRMALFQSSRFFVEGDADRSTTPSGEEIISSWIVVPSKTNIKKNIYQGKSVHEMMIAYDLVAGGKEQ